MEDLVIRILGIAVWMIAVGFLLRSLYMTERPPSAERSAVHPAEKEALELQAAYAVCYEQCAGDYLGYGYRDYCRNLCSSEEGIFK